MQLSAHMNALSDLFQFSFLFLLISCVPRQLAARFLAELRLPLLYCESTSGRLRSDVISLVDFSARLRLRLSDLCQSRFGGFNDLRREYIVAVFLCLQFAGRGRYANGAVDRGNSVFEPDFVL